MKKDVAKNLGAAIFNAMYWATIPQATNHRLGAIEGLTKALLEAFPDAPAKTRSKSKSD